MNVCSSPTTVGMPCLRCGDALYVIDEPQHPRFFGGHKSYTMSLFYIRNQGAEQTARSTVASYLRHLQDFLAYVELNREAPAGAVRNSIASALCRQWEDMDRSDTLHMHMEALERSID